MVSIIVPIYNTEPYLARCIDSVMSQTYENWELILVDDGSTDKSREICMQYCRADSRIHYIYQQNRGVSAARNKGVYAAKGDYFFFMDSDDAIKSELLETTVGHMEKGNLDLLYFNAKFVAYQGSEDWNPDVVVGDFAIAEYRQKLNFIIKSFFTYSMKYSVWNKIYNASLIRQKKIFFDDGIKIGEDLGFNVKYLLAAKTVKGIADELYFYIQRPDSAMSGDGNQVFKINESSKMMEQIRAEYRKTGFPWRGYRQIFIRMMDNQYKKRINRAQFKQFVKLVEDQRFLIKETLSAVLHPFDFIQIYGNPEAKRKWKDHLYILKYLLL